MFKNELESYQRIHYLEIKDDRLNHGMTKWEPVENFHIEESFEQAKYLNDYSVKLDEFDKKKFHTVDFKTYYNIIASFVLLPSFDK